ncbi:MAG: hypothetical protein GVY36_08100 [Verrucomicrobia bacterium]|jgi:hypothetical protein|nr:hypothetical protein [Verrucomicrobiota bacterium]
MNIKQFYLTLVSIFFVGALTCSAAQLSSAKVLSVEGTVFKYAKDSGNTPLEAGDILVEGDSVSVTALSSARLVFSNGSLITVNENTSFDIAKLTQQPFSGSASYEQLQADPSVSQTLLEINYGRLDFHVKKLRQGSSFDIESPLGTAAIRGTQGSARLFYNAERAEFMFVVENVDGAVDIISRFGGEIEYGSGNIGDKGYDSGLPNDTAEPIPQSHIVIVRLSRGDPLFDDLYRALQNFIPTETPTGTIELPLPEITPEDPGVIVVSPEVQSGSGGSEGDGEPTSVESDDEPIFLDDV